MKDEPQQNNVEVRLGLRSQSSFQAKSALIQYDMSDDDDNLATNWSLKMTI